MNNEQALQIIKNALDLAVKNGIFHNLDSASVTLQAFQKIVLIVKGNEEAK